MIDNSIAEIVKILSKTAIEAVLPENFIPAAVSRKGKRLTINGESYDLGKYRHIYILSVGKAAVGMAAALDDIIHSYVTEGIVLTKHLPEEHTLGKRYRVMKGGHPVPDEDSIAGADAILALLEKARENDLVIFLISGGGSALMSKPVEGLDLRTYQDFCSEVLGCGADIQEFNTLRKHLDRVKGGGLAKCANPADQITLILSDVVGSTLDVIASGPTVPDPSTYQDALEILDRYSDRASFPKCIRDILERGCAGKLPETLKADEPIQPDIADAFLLADNRLAALVAADKGEELGFDAQVLNTELTGEAKLIGSILPSFFSELTESGLLIFGGETTVNIRGNGLGGRNLELALASVKEMAKWPDCVLFTLATDGEDGPTDAAGAIVTSETFHEALDLGLDPDEYLRNNDSYHFFQKLRNLIRTDPSGTNVNDLTFLMKL